MESAGRGRGHARGRGLGNGEPRPPGPPSAQPPGADGNAIAPAMRDLNLIGGRGLGARPRLNSEEYNRKRNEEMDLVPTKPQALVSKQGSSGVPFQLVTNHFGFRRKADFRLNQYRVDLSVEEDRTFVKKAIVYRAMGNDKFPKYIFDGTVMLTTEPIYAHKQQGKDQPFVVKATYKKDSDGPEEPMEIRLKLVGELHSTDHQYTHFFNLLMKQQLILLDLKQMGKSYYDLKGKVEESEWKLQVIPGYTTSVRQHENEVLMVVEISHKVVRCDTVLEQIRVMLQKNMSINDVKNTLIGAVVITTYSDKTYRVDDVDEATRANSSFEKKDGSKITYIEYFKTRYGIVIQDPNQFLLISRPTEKDMRGNRNDPVMLVPELVRMTGLTDQMRANFRLMESMAVYTRMDPPNRMARLDNFSKRLTRDPKIKTHLRGWGMEMDPQPVQVKGRLLDPEIIYLEARGGKPREVKYNGNSRWGADWGNALSKGLANPVPIRKWIIVFPQFYGNNVQHFLREMMSSARNFMDIGDPLQIPIRDTNTRTYIQEVKEALKKNPLFIMVVIPDETSQLYPVLKKLLLCEHPIPNQIVTNKKVISKTAKHKTFAPKIAIQMTSKIGGVPWTVKIPINDCMVVGFDTYHDATRKGSSWGALTAGLNLQFSKFFSDVSEHPSKQEMSDNIPILFLGALRAYHKANKKYPTRVFFYRDGVGDGQIRQVLDHEVAEIAKKCEKEKIMLTFIIVSKRINTRFFGPDKGSYNNPPSGTVVDSVVTLPERYDFFLISQSVKQGTVNPTSYNVIHDKSGLKPDHIQKLSYKLCHLYFNWSGTVRVPAVCQYAHKLAQLIGDSVHARPDESLREYPYYL